MYKKDEIEERTRRQVLSAIFKEYGKSGPEESPAFEGFIAEHGWSEFTPEPTPEPTPEELYDQAVISRLIAYQSRSDCKFMEYQYDSMVSTDPDAVEAKRLEFVAADPGTADAELATWQAAEASAVEVKRLAWLAEVASIKEEFTLPELEFLRDEGLLP